MGSKVVIKEGNRPGSLGPGKSPGQADLGDELHFSSPDSFPPDGGSGILGVLSPPGCCNLSLENFGPPIFLPSTPLVSRSRARHSDPGALRRSPGRLRVPELGTGSEGSGKSSPTQPADSGSRAHAVHAFHRVMRSPPGLESIPVGLSSLLFFNYSPESQ